MFQRHYWIQNQGLKFTKILLGIRQTVPKLALRSKSKDISVLFVCHNRRLVYASYIQPDCNDQRALTLPIKLPGSSKLEKATGISKLSEILGSRPEIATEPKHTWITMLMAFPALRILLFNRMVYHSEGLGSAHAPQRPSSSSKHPQPDSPFTPGKQRRKQKKESSTVLQPKTYVVTFKSLTESDAYDDLKITQTVIINEERSVTIQAVLQGQTIHITSYARRSAGKRSTALFLLAKFRFVKDAKQDFW